MSRITAEQAEQALEWVRTETLFQMDDREVPETASKNLAVLAEFIHQRKTRSERGMALRLGSVPDGTPGL